jgi:hypothetical protein
MFFPKAAPNPALEPTRQKTAARLSLVRYGDRAEDRFTALWSWRRSFRIWPTTVTLQVECERLAPVKTQR